MSNQSDMQYCPECGIKSTAGAKVLSGKKGTVAASMNEMERLRKERDTARRDYEVMNMFREAAEKGLEAALEREQALAAHVEMLKAVFIEGFESTEDHDLDAWEQEAKRMLAATPDATTLTKRDLIKQAEGASAVRHLTQGNDWEDDELRIVIDDYITTLHRRASDL